MIRAKEALVYLVEYLTKAGSDFGGDLSAETVRMSKMNDPRASEDLVLFIASLIAKVHRFRFGPEVIPETAKQILNLYLCLNPNPFLLEINGNDYYDLKSPQSLLKILCWMLFSNPNFLKRIDEMFVASLKRIEAVHSKEEVVKEEKDRSHGIMSESIAQKSFEDIKDLAKLKSILFLKLDQLKDSQKCFNKKNKLMNSKIPGSMLKYIANPQLAEEVIIEKEKKLKDLEHFKDQICHRKTIIEWMGNVTNEQKKQNPELESLREIGDIEEAESVAADLLNIELVQFQNFYNDISQKLESMYRQSSEIKKFSQFWEEISQKLSKNPEYKKKIGATVSRETIRLENRYKKHKVNDHKNGLAGEEKKEKLIDVFQILADLQTSRNQPQKKSSSNEAPLRTKKTKISNPKETIRQVKDEFEQFLSEVEEHINKHDIYLIKK